MIVADKKYLDKEKEVYPDMKTFFIRNFFGEKVNKGSVSYKKLKFLETRHSMLTERRKAIPYPAIKAEGSLA